MKIVFKTGKDIKRFRKARKCTQRSFARAIDITETWVSNLENSDKEIGEDVLLKIEKYQKELAAL